MSEAHRTLGKKADLGSNQGFLYGQLSSKVIIAQLTKGPFPFSPALTLPLIIPSIGVNTPLLGLPQLLPPTFERWYLHLALVLSFISYMSFATSILDAFCRYLNISAFTIPHAGNPKRSPIPTEDSDAAPAEAPASIVGRVQKYGRGLGIELKEMIGVEGRKRSNTSEREEGVDPTAGRRVARVT